MMSRDNRHAVWVGSSNYAEKVAELKANHESEELKNILERGFKVTNIRVKRPRIKKEIEPKKVVISLGSVMNITMTLSWEDYKKRGTGLKIIKWIY